MPSRPFSLISLAKKERASPIYQPRLVFAPCRDPRRTSK